MSELIATGRRILLLQGPVGPYFRRLAAQLRDQGAAAVVKVNFNGGDRLFYPGGIDYTGKTHHAAAFVETLIDRERIDLVILTGDCRPVHAGVAALCSLRGVELRVFEEGYFRPAYITCEFGGVNGYSAIPNDPDFYRGLGEQEPVREAMPARRTWWAMAAWATLYYLACKMLAPLYPHYRHHRPLHVLAEGMRWIRSAVRKWKYRYIESSAMSRLTGELSGRFFLVPLQVHNDAQVQVHSPYPDVVVFIAETIRSFAENAPADTVLVLKHHPMDRAYRDYRGLIEFLEHSFNAHGRVLYIHDQHLPTLLDHARGAVVINSTVGLAAVHQGVPTKVMGKAFYDFAGLTYQGALDFFWRQARDHVPDRGLYLTFRRWVIRHTQINDSFYRPIRGAADVDNETHRAPKYVHAITRSRVQESLKA